MKIGDRPAKFASDPDFRLHSLAFSPAIQHEIRGSFCEDNEVPEAVGNPQDTRPWLLESRHGPLRHRDQSRGHTKYPN